MKKPISSAIALILIALFGVGCTPAATPITLTSTSSPMAPTLTPAPTATETLIPSPTPLPLPLKLVVPANAGWVATGLILEPGQAVLISSTGTVDYNGDDPNAGESDSDGDGSSCNKSTIEAIINQKLTIDCLATGVSWGALVGRVADAAPFLVGFKYELTAEKGGELLLGVNDCCSLTDNTGEYQVTISSP